MSLLLKNQVNHPFVTRRTTETVTAADCMPAGTPQSELMPRTCSCKAVQTQSRICHGTLACMHDLLDQCTQEFSCHTIPIPLHAALLTMRLRDFLSSSSTTTARISSVPYTIHEGASASREAQRSQYATSTRTPAGYVWVDCFFYGFWMEEAKARGAGMLSDSSPNAAHASQQAALIVC